MIPSRTASLSPLRKTHLVLELCPISCRVSKQWFNTYIFTPNIHTYIHTLQNYKLTVHKYIHSTYIYSILRYVHANLLHYKHTYIHTNIHTYLLTNIHTYIHTNLCIVIHNKYIHEAYKKYHRIQSRTVGKNMVVVRTRRSMTSLVDVPLTSEWNCTILSRRPSMMAQRSHMNGDCLSRHVQGRCLSVIAIKFGVKVVLAVEAQQTMYLNDSY